MNRRYLLFAGSHEPKHHGGANDFQSAHGELDAALDAGVALDLDWWHVFDLESLRIVAGGSVVRGVAS